MQQAPRSVINGAAGMRDGPMELCTQQVVHKLARRLLVVDRLVFEDEVWTAGAQSATEGRAGWTGSLAHATRTVVPPAFDCKGPRRIRRQARVCLPKGCRKVQEWIRGRYFHLPVSLGLSVRVCLLNGGVNTVRLSLSTGGTHLSRLLFRTLALNLLELAQQLRRVVLVLITVIFVVPGRRRK